MHTPDAANLADDPRFLDCSEADAQRVSGQSSAEEGNNAMEGTRFPLSPQTTHQCGAASFRYSHRDTRGHGQSKSSAELGSVITF
jgi:hypothetical protein